MICEQELSDLGLQSNQIIHTNLDTIKSLKGESTNMKKKERCSRIAFNEMSGVNKKNKAPFEEAQREKLKLTEQLERYMNMKRN